MKLTAKEKLNIKLASEDVKDLLGLKVEVKGFIFYDSNSVDSETGEIIEKTVCGFMTTSGTAYSSPSPTLIDCAMAISEYAEEEKLDTVIIKIITAESKKGRDFYQMTVV